MALTTDVLAKLVVFKPRDWSPGRGVFFGSDLGAAAGVAPFLKSRRVPIPDGAG
jgi:hypothetical protein